MVAVLACEDPPAKEEDGSAEGCSSGTVCLIDDDCPGGTRCNEETCTDLFCLDDGVPCSTSEVCVSRECVRNPSGRVCWSGERGAGWSCSGDADCMGDLICDGGECSTAVAELGVVPATLPFYLVEGASNSPGLIMIISNSGTAPLVFEIQAEVPWVSTDVSTGALPPNAEQEVSIAVDGTGLSAGESSPS